MRIRHVFPVVIAAIIGLLPRLVVGQETALLWPQGAPGEDEPDAEQVVNRDVDQNRHGLNRSYSNVTRPTMTTHLPPPEKRTGVAVVILPGGGFSRVVIDKEGHDVACRLNGLGVAAFVVKYRTGERDHPAAVQDVRRAIRVVRSRADSLGIAPGKIGLMGFSAGGYLAIQAALAPTDDHADAADPLVPISARPDFLGVIYPVVPEDPASAMTDDMPPAFLVHAGDDQLSPSNSVRFYSALLDRQIPAELHIYATGGHGFGLGVQGGAVATWPDRFRDWMITLGILDSEETPSRVVLAIGDSNGASDDGWVQQLRRLRPQDTIINKSVSGNTIGFDNLGQERLNTFKNIDVYLADALQEAGGRSIDEIILALGTNDSKAVFAERSEAVPENLRRLIRRIRAYTFPGQQTPRLTILSPPPYGPDSLLQAKYHGGDARVQALVSRFKTVAGEEGCGFVDVYHPLKPRFQELSPDGVHLTVEGQQLMARYLNQYLNSERTP